MQMDFIRFEKIQILSNFLEIHNLVDHLQIFMLFREN